MSNFLAEYQFVNRDEFHSTAYKDEFSNSHLFDRQLFIGANVTEFGKNSEGAKLMEQMAHNSDDDTVSSIEC